MTSLTQLQLTFLGEWVDVSTIFQLTNLRDLSLFCKTDITQEFTLLVQLTRLALFVVDMSRDSYADVEDVPFDLMRSLELLTLGMGYYVLGTNFLRLLELNSLRSIRLNTLDAL